MDLLGTLTWQLLTDISFLIGRWRFVEKMLKYFLSFSSVNDLEIDLLDFVGGFCQIRLLKNGTKSRTFVPCLCTECYLLHQKSTKDCSDSVMSKWCCLRPWGQRPSFCQHRQHNEDTECTSFSRYLSNLFSLFDRAFGFDWHVGVRSLRSVTGWDGGCEWEWAEFLIWCMASWT
jgi:hypothetical protein